MTQPESLFLMGNAAFARGALDSGVSLVTGYPGTPSTEVLETVAKLRKPGVYVEWSVNEKAALEVAAGGSISGARTLVTMKQVGLNVASDPLMSLAYIGVKGGLVIMVADDPGPISSQTEQDTTTFARFAKIPILDPSNPQEAYDMMREAFELSERLETPVIVRSTTRVSHGYASVELSEALETIQGSGFVKNPRWVIFPRLSYQRHVEIEKRNRTLTKEFSEWSINRIEQESDFSANSHASSLKDSAPQDLGGSSLPRIGIATRGVAYEYVREALAQAAISVPLLKVSTPFPFPNELAVEFMSNLDEVFVFEELDPTIERELTLLCGREHMGVAVHGKEDLSVPYAGELSTEIVADVLRDVFALHGVALHSTQSIPLSQLEVNDFELPLRPPTLCAGCPHRASFLAVKRAMRGKKSIFTGDIGCYTLGNAEPLDMVDTCLCMGAGFTMAQGISRIESSATVFAFIGDSTFFASGITGVVNAVYNNASVVFVVLDNSITAMTGGQPHPGVGTTMMGSQSGYISIEAVLTSMGVKVVGVLDPFNRNAAEKIVTKAAAIEQGPRAIIFRAPCIQQAPKGTSYVVDADLCTGCRLCIKTTGCPALIMGDSTVSIDEDLCWGCSLCAQHCPFDAISLGGLADE